MKKIVLIILSILSCLFALTGCTYQKEMDALQSQIDALQNEINSLQQQLTSNDSPEFPVTEELQTDVPAAPMIFNRYPTDYGDLIQYQSAPMLTAEEMVKLAKGSAVSVKVNSSSGFNLNCGGTVLLHGQSTTLILISAYSIKQFDQIFVVLQENSETVELPATVLNYDQEANVAILQVEGVVGVDDVGAVLPYANVVGFRRRENGDDLLRIWQMRLVLDILLQLRHAVGDILFREPVLRLDENDELVALELDVREFVLLFGMADKELLVVLANPFECLRIAVLSCLKVCDEEFGADCVDYLLPCHFSVSP